MLAKHIYKMEDLGINTDNDYVLDSLNLDLEMEYNTNELFLHTESLQETYLVGQTIQFILDEVKREGEQIGTTN